MSSTVSEQRSAARARSSDRERHSTLSPPRTAPFRRPSPGSHRSNRTAPMKPLLWSTLATLLVASTLSAQTRTIAERLGHPANTKLLILHADDLGVAHSEDSASFDALNRGAV